MRQKRASAASRARISVSAVAMEMVLAPVLADFRDAYPDFQLDIVVEDGLTDPVARRYDAVIRRGDLLDQDMVARRVSKDDQLILVASEGWLASHPSPHHPRDLVQDRIVIRRPRSGAVLPWSLTHHSEAVTMKGGANLVVESALAARAYAVAGLGVALLAHGFVADMIAQGRLCRILPEWSSPVSGFYLMYAHRGTLPVALNDLLHRMINS